MSIVLLLISIAVWGVIHSVLASMLIKRKLSSWMGPGIFRFYRLAYNFLSVLSFLPIAWLALTLSDQPLYRVPAPWSYVMRMGQAVGLVLLIMGVLQTDLLSFIGFRQIVEGEHSSSLVTRGLYKYVRHPLYSAGLLILWLMPSVSVNTLIVMVGLTCYILIGAWFEEKKLQREFGLAYTQYRSSTPMLLPRFGFPGSKTPE